MRVSRKNDNIIYINKYINKYIMARLVLVTGGTGFLGQKLIAVLLAKNYKIRVVARNEGKLMQLQMQYPDVEIMPGDIANKITAYQACKDVTGIFHLAAFKHVRMAEEYSLECINSNVIGTLNILNETLDNKNLEFVVGISTDKVALVTGTYSASKFLMESLFKQFERLNANVNYRLVRYGNVLYSTGSVLCIWKDKLLKGDEIIITDKQATRFYWTIEEAVDLIFKCLDNATSCEPYLPEMKSMNLNDLLNAMALKYLPNDKELLVKEIGLQYGENLHERLITDGPTSNDTVKYTVDEIYNLI